MSGPARRPTHDNGHASQSHSALATLAGCGLMLVALLVFSAGGTGWAFILLLAAVLLCPLMMLVMRPARTLRQRLLDRRRRHEEPA